MNPADISALARHLFETEGARAISAAGQKAASFEAAGDREESKVWRQVEVVLRELQGPHQS